MKKVFLCTMLIVGTMMGAGFCSGKEIVVYFARFGPVALFFVPALFLLYFFMFRTFMMFGRGKSFDNVQCVNQHLFGKRKKTINVLVFFIYLVFSSAMLAGVAQIGQLIGGFVGQLFLPAALMFCFVVLLKPFNIITKINTILVPIMLVLILINCGIGLFAAQSELQVIYKPSLLLFINPVLYACQGVSLGYYVLARAGEQQSKKQIGATAALSAGVLCFLQMVSMIVFWLHPNLLNQSMPMLTLAFMNGWPMDIVYFLAMFFAIITTLFCTTRALCEFVQTKIKGKSTSAIFSLCLPLFLSYLGFDKIVEMLYPIIGIIGLFMLFAVLSKKSALKQTFKFVNCKIHKTSKNTKQSG